MATSNIRLGTSGYSFADWVGPFYPPGTKRGEMLEHYARSFDVAEVNSTYYGIPRPRVFERMAARTPDGFTFTVKAHRSATHERGHMEREMPAFRDGLAPLREAGKLGGVLLQFPWAFRPGPTTFDHLSRARELLRDTRLFAEFRHASWDRDDVYAFLHDRDIGACAVDEPELPGLMPPVTRVTSSEGDGRFHGRNRATWWGDAPGDRYDWRYTRAELATWVERIRALAARTQLTYVFFNNCHEGQAVEGARLLAHMLDEADERERGTA